VREGSSENRDVAKKTKSSSSRPEGQRPKTRANAKQLSDRETVKTKLRCAKSGRTKNTTQKLVYL
jgi:hypothetical protein